MSTRRSGRTPTPKRQDTSNVYYEEDLHDVFEDNYENDDDDSDEDPDFKEEEIPEEASHDEPFDEEEPPVGNKRNFASFNTNSPAFKKHCAQNAWNITNTGSSENPVAQNLQGYQYMGSTYPRPPPAIPTRPQYSNPNLNQQTSFYRPMNGGQYPSRPTPPQSQNIYDQARYPNGQFQQPQNAYVAPRNYQQPMYDSGQSMSFTNQMNQAYQPQQHSYQQQQQPVARPQAQAPQASYTSQAELRVRNLLIEHHKRSKLQNVPHEISLEQLKREISSSPELIEALRNIRQRAFQQRMNQTNQSRVQGGRPGYPQNYPVMHSINNQHVPGSLRASLPDKNYLPPNQFHGGGSYQQTLSGGYAQQYDQGNMNIQPPPMYPQNTITTRPPLIKQTLNAEMASSLMKQTGSSTPVDPPDNAIAAIKNPVDEDAVEQENLSELSESERKIEVVMRKCEGISRQLRDSLQKHLKSLLGDEKEKKEEEEKDEKDEKDSKENIDIKIAKDEKETKK